jgi:hypothetical protein
MKKQLGQKFAILACVLAAILTPSAKADFLYHVDLDVSSLLGNASAPFYLDFQLNKGNGFSTNSVTLSNFLFTGTSAGPSGSAVPFGLTFGDLGSSISLNENSTNPNAELYQAFTAGTTDIQFNVTLTQNSPGSIPDGFNMSILDNGLSNIQTTDPNGGTLANWTMMGVSITNNNSLADVATYQSTAPAGATVTASTSVVPEPSSALALLSSSVMLLGFRRHRISARPQAVS